MVAIVLLKAYIQTNVKTDDKILQTCALLHNSLPSNFRIVLTFFKLWA